MEQVPRKSYVGRQLERITIEIVDESGRVDTAVDGYMHSVTADWLKGVTCVFAKGECVLPDFKLPAKPGMWHGKVSFSADRNLSVTLSVSFPKSCTFCADGYSQLIPGRTAIRVNKWVRHLNLDLIWRSI